MAKRPVLPLEDQAEIERSREHIRQHALATWSLLFGIESLGPYNSRAPGMSHERKPASLKLELRDYSRALFDAEAQHYARRAASEELRSSLEIVAECIETEVMAEIHAPSHDFHCAPAERRQTIRDALKERIQYWLSVQQKQNQKPVVSRAPPPPPPMELGGGMRFELPGQKAFDAAKPPKQSEVSTATRFPRRASWLSDRLRERAWNKNDPARYGGPDRKTIQRILDGLNVREDGLEKLADALSKKGGKVNVVGIPNE